MLRVEEASLKDEERGKREGELGFSVGDERLKVESAENAAAAAIFG